MEVDVVVLASLQEAQHEGMGREQCGREGFSSGDQGEVIQVRVTTGHRWDVQKWPVLPVTQLCRYGVSYCGPGVHFMSLRCQLMKCGGQVGDQG